MKRLPLRKQPDHPSYKKHRGEVWSQILLPVLLGAAVLFVGPIIVWVAALGGTGDLQRWAAISTMWLLIPVMVSGMILLSVLIVLIFITARIAGWIPRYTVSVQRFAGSAAGGTRRAAAMIRRPVLALREIGSLARSGWQRLRERA